MTRVHSFEEAARIVAHEFFRDMQDNGFETFQEMAQCYWWEPQDIKEEVSYILTIATENASMWDDGTHVVLGDEDMYYRDFKKRFMAYIKELSATTMKNR